MRIAFIVSHFPLLSETFILNQITGLLDRGHEVDIYATFAGNKSHMHPDIDRYRLLERTYYLPKIPENLLWRFIKAIGLLCSRLHQNPAQLLRSLNFKSGKQATSLWLLYAAIPALRQQPYDIVHCQFGTLGVWGMAFREINAPNGKLITIFRGHDISSYVREKGDHIYRSLFATGDFFLTNCEFFQRRLLQLGCDSNKVEVHYSGVNCDRFTFIPRTPAPDGTIRIATTGRLVEKKGIEYSIRAVAKAAAVYPNLEYTIVGDGELRSRFEQLIAELGIAGKAKLVGQKNQQELIEILDRSHIFLAPSVTASDGNQDAPINVLKEAMAMGLPVISTVHGGIPELVQNGVSGFLVPERNADALAEKLIDLIANPDCWLPMGKAGRVYVETHFNLHWLNDRLLQLYQHLLDANAYPDLKPNCLPTFLPDFPVLRM